jgi:hypothetical protein
VVETARDEIAGLLVAAHPRSSEPSVLHRLDRAIDDARDRGLDDDGIEAQLRSWAVQYPRRSHGWTGADAAIADLRTLLVGPGSGGARVWDRLRGIANWAFEHYVAVAGLVGVIAGVFYGLAYARFYQALDITPEQVGLSPAQIVTRSVLGGVAFTLYLSFLAFALILPLIAARVDPGARSERGSWKGLAANATLFLGGVCFLVVAVGMLLLGETFRDSVPAAYIPALLLLAISFRIRKLGGRRSLHLRPLRFNASKYLTAYVAFAVPVGLLVTGGFTLKEARSLGEVASEGTAIRNPEIFGLPFLGVRAEPALVSWKEGQPANANIPRCVFYLGSSDGDAVLYSQRSHSTLHVPSGDVTVELRSEMWSCETPIDLRLPWVTEPKPHQLVCHQGRWLTDIPPHFSFVWTLGGDPIPNGSRDRVFRKGAKGRGYTIHCRVTASTELGSAMATSDGVVRRGAAAGSSGLSGSG